LMFVAKKWKDEEGILMDVSKTNEKLNQDLRDMESLLRAEKESKAHLENAAKSGENLGNLEVELKDKVDELESSKLKVKELENAGKQREKAMNRLKKAHSEMALTVLIDTSEGEMEIEMAPCNLMPVVTMYFIKQVEEGFWDGMVFFRAESHVIQATDMRPDRSRQNRKRSQSIPFQEYSEDFVHHKYTLGIAGRPGGPDFYINMSENIKIHGPGGQGHNYQGDPESDSCFAKIIRGREIADRIQKLPYKRVDGLHILETPVEIRSMRLL
jgi:cyclophilin family peptidyl-prolyl cis-trans isomerase